MSEPRGGSAADRERPAAAEEQREPLAAEIFDDADGSLLELVDHLLNQGVVLSGEVILGLANVEQIYLRISALLCAADRVLPPPKPPPPKSPPPKSPPPNDR